MDILEPPVRHLAKWAEERLRRRGWLVLVVLLLVFTGAAAPQASASAEAMKWTSVNMPVAGDAGGWALAPGSDVYRLAAAPDGAIYASVRGLDYTLFRSNDGGHTWSHPGNVRDEIVDIAVSGDGAAVHYATPSAVFRSQDGGRTFISIPAGVTGAGTDGREITALAVSGENGDVIAIAVRDTDISEFGGIYTLDVSSVVPAWEDTGLGLYDALYVAFSPGFDHGGQIAAIVTDETDTHVFTRTGDAPWNATLGAARLNRGNAAASPVAAARGVLAFDDAGGPLYPDSVFYAAVADGAGGGDVFRVTCQSAPQASTAADLNIGAAHGESDIDIGGLAAGSGALLAIAADARTFVSTDGGLTWTRDRKKPAGGEGTSVLIGSGGRMYAATGGQDGGVAASEDSGTTWAQVGLIDTYIDTIIDMAPSPEYESDGTLFVLSFGGGHSLWRSRDGGVSWERTLSTNPSAGDTTGMLALPPQYGEGCRSVFLAGESGGQPAVWESTDNGQTFRRRVTRAPGTGSPFAIDVWAVTAETELVVGSYAAGQGLIFRSNSGGFIYEVAAPAGNQPISSIAVYPGGGGDDIILAGNTAGRLYISEDGGVSFTPLPSQPLIAGPVHVAFDPGFGANGTVYAAADAAGGGLYRLKTGGAWEEIDASAPDGARFNRPAFGAVGALYVSNSTAGGGIERSLDPGASSGAAFETVTRGLDVGATLCGLWSAGNRLWSIDTYINKPVTFLDTLTSAVTLVSPEDGGGGLGMLNDHTVRDVRLDWETLEGATGYEWQCNYENDFSDTPAGLSGSVSSSLVRLPALEPATTYYWRVRAASPVTGPWSDKRSFTTALDTDIVALRPESPAPGATGVPLRPFFQWTAVSGADAYELLVAGNIDFSSPTVSRTVPASAWQCDMPLDHAATYYWKVRAVTALTRSPWSAAGVFTTEDEPVIGTPAGMPTTISVARLPVPATTIATPASPAQAPPVTTAPPVSETPPLAAGYYSLPAWALYLIAALILTIILSLVVLLITVQKIRR